MASLRFVVGAAAVLGSTLAAASPDSFDWGSIAPSNKLEFHPCLDELQCARLVLPLDWLNETKRDTVTIAILKVPAVVSQDDPSYAGPMFTNPGGPGGSGVDYVLSAGRRLQAFLDIPGKKHYDLVSFDPRGVGRSEPLTDCFPASTLGRSAGLLEGLASGSLDMSPASFAYGLMAAKALGKRCERVIEDLLPYVNTPSVARDMVAMVDLFDELRKKEAAQHQDTGAQLELRSENKPSGDVPRLQYIGFSYGTILGNYFASLFPERVGRVMLDGVCNADDYATGPGWLTNTGDSDRMLELFFEGCFDAGSEICKLRQPDDKSALDISKRVLAWIESLDMEPIMATTPDGDVDLFLRSSDMRILIALNLYLADYTFYTLSLLFSEALNGNTVPIAAAVLKAYAVPALSEGCVTGNDTVVDAKTTMAEANAAILCSDGDDVSDKNSTYWRNYMEKQLSQSSLFGGLWTSVRMSCAGWTTRPNWSFKGPFTTPKASKDPSSPEPGRPAAPVLFLSSRWDPVTPLRAARAMRAQHPGAGLLVQESMGHSVLGIGYGSECTRKVVAEFLEHGVVPTEEVACDGIKTPWENVLAVQDTQVTEFLQRRTRFNPLGF